MVRRIILEILLNVVPCSSKDLLPSISECVACISFAKPIVEMPVTSRQVVRPINEISHPTVIEFCTQIDIVHSSRIGHGFQMVSSTIHKNSHAVRVFSIDDSEG